MKRAIALVTILASTQIAIAGGTFSAQGARQMGVSGSATAPALPAFTCPDAEKLIASIPDATWPQTLTLTANDTARFKAWSDANAVGKVIDLASMKNGTYAYAKRRNVEIKFVNSGSNAKTATCESVTITVINKTTLVVRITVK